MKWTADEDDGGAVTSYTLNGSGAIDTQTTTATGGAPGTITDNTYDYNDEGERLDDSKTRDVGAPAGTGITTDYDYDAGGLGEITSQATNGQASITYSYDEFGRQTGSDNGQGKLDTYTHDGLDRRDTKTSEGETFDLSYIGSSESLSQEQQFGGTETRSYDYDSQMDRLGMDRQGVAGLDANGYRAFSKDANGSVEGLEDKEGEIPKDDKYSYDPYGALTDQDGNTASSGSESGTGGGTGGVGGIGGSGGGQQPPDNEPAGEAAQANPFRFQGHYYDSGVKTYDMQARPYSPQAGRFLTEDRYESAAGDLSLEADALTQDRYSFAGGNPINNIEYDGHEPIGSYNPNGEQTIRGQRKRSAEGERRQKEYGQRWASQPEEQVRKQPGRASGDKPGSNGRYEPIGQPQPDDSLKEVANFGLDFLKEARDDGKETASGLKQNATEFLADPISENGLVEPGPRLHTQAKPHERSSTAADRAQGGASSMSAPSDSGAAASPRERRRCRSQRAGGGLPQACRLRGQTYEVRSTGQSARSARVAVQPMDLGRTPHSTARLRHHQTFVAKFHTAAVARSRLGPQDLSE